MDNRIEIGKRIKQRREQLGWTQEQLGKKLWLNKSTIQRYESGIVAKIKIPILHAMAKQMNVDPKWLLLKTDIMGKFSQLLKKDGYIVSMAPAESYLDSSTDEFSLSLLYNYPEWEKKCPDFNYHGRNAYAYLLAKYSVDTFDFISVQLYEGYSHTLFKYKKNKQNLGIILYDLINSFIEGFVVDFSKEENSGMGKEIIKIPKEKIVIGLANGWAGDRFLFVNEKNKGAYNDDDILMKLVKQRNFLDLPEVDEINNTFSFQLNFPSVFIIICLKYT